MQSDSVYIARDLPPPCQELQSLELSSLLLDGETYPTSFYVTIYFYSKVSIWSLLICGNAGGISDNCVFVCVCLPESVCERERKRDVCVCVYASILGFLKRHCTN